MKWLSFLPATVLASCEDAAAKRAAHLTGGDPARGRVAVRFHGCGSCHTIPESTGPTRWSAPRWAAS